MTTPTVPARLLQALLQIHHSNPRLIASPATVGSASRRAAVAIIIRLRPAPATVLPPSPPPPPAPTSPIPSPAVPSVPTQLAEFFSQPWVQDPSTTAEILYIKRATRNTDKWSGHIAFPGGRQEPSDEDGRYTAMRETWEEVGLDLAEKSYVSVGQLDDREITTSLGKRLLMVLSPFVFLHTSPATPIPELQETEVASAHWIAIESLHPPAARYDVVGIDLSTRLAPRSATMRVILRFLLGSMHFKCILLPNDPVAIGQLPPPGEKTGELRLWGLTLGMTLDLLSHMSVYPANSPTTKGATYPDAIASLPSPASSMSPLAPSMASIFPTFSYPDINLLIHLFGWRYRRLLKSSGSPVSPPTNDPRVNWAGMSLGAYYSAVRRALVVAVVIRGMLTAGGLGWLAWWWTGKRRQARLIK
ncbi:NUDIX hydrolase domain containing protein [Pseudohyphozyma bogoriensis]|nr:NUDIX hydrolase domain containing protein [Pseudohyphozyma bogoriensis]